MFMLTVKSLSVRKKLIMLVVGGVLSGLQHLKYLRYKLKSRERIGKR